MSHKQQISVKQANYSLIEAISKELPNLSKTQIKVAKTILADPKSAIESSIASLAKKSAGVNPALIDFVSASMQKGFPDLKLRIARSLASGVCYVYPKIHAADKVDSFTPKIFDAAIINLALVRENICYQRIDQIVEKLTQQGIFIYALGASAIVARDVHKFLSLNLPVSSHDDILIHQMLAAKGHKNDVFFIISDAQQNKEMIEVAQTVINNGATLISMTASENLRQN